jgi:hypothetical protein
MFMTTALIATISVLLDAGFIILLSHRPDELQPHGVNSIGETPIRRGGDQLNQYVHRWKANASKTKRLAQHSLYSIAINRTPELSFADNQPKPCCRLVVRSRIHAEAGVSQLHNGMRQHVIELPFARQSVFTREGWARRYDLRR